MADDKAGREKKADDAERRQQERELTEARERGDETEPPRAEEGGADEGRTCHRRGCDELATFVVLERYQEETGHGPVESEAFLCREHTAEESPVNLDDAYAEYVFRVDPVPGAFDSAVSE